ncbi:glycosyltransferase [Vibrio vulnificus]|uniref:CppA n=1 Tax=Vibrio vulnificus TaxID=672 RepID=E5F0S8_VIBVL|nr:glycosyltransferase [Vibrio vulnificus]ADO64239.1 CppA [Vibrio vulnificus NBRC 15645 = ATCC 27562]ASM96106.1 hypothetical protein AOT11_12825 [Vibrio vulnificus NBRC 15645 = ATCC 27562]MCL7020348.1 glycosyltransferase [Vibrio vulnificus]MDK2702098.1 glycosyltransferase [Vibrio vulnificus]QET75162.1 glycosyltransferase [Vibrio vulnificus]
MIGFIIGTFSHGRGGHVWDLKVIAETLSKHKSCVIFNIGCSESPVLEESNLEVINLPLELYKSTKLMSEEVKKRSIKTLIVIDVRVSIIPSLVSSFHTIPIISIKPGGPNPKKYFPTFGKLIVYSQENYEYFKLNSEYSFEKLSFIPNRCSKVKVNKSLVKDIEKKVGKDTFIFLQIIRIVEEYHSNISKAISLIKKLSEDKSVNSSALVLVGVPQCSKTLAKVKEEAKGYPVYILNDDIYTKKASELIDIADVVIANGRGVMEASSRSKPILISSVDEELPVVLNEYNFSHAFSVNFSPRLDLTDVKNEDYNNFNAIKSVINDQAYYNELADFSKSKFSECFDVEEGVKDYIEIIDSSKFQKIKPKDVIFSLKIYLFSVIKLIFKGRV